MVPEKRLYSHATDISGEIFGPRTTHERVDTTDRGVGYLEWVWDVGFEGQIVEDPANDGERSEVFLGKKSCRVSVGNLYPTAGLIR